MVGTVYTPIIVDRLDSSDLRKQGLEARFQENRFPAKESGCPRSLYDFERQPHFSLFGRITSLISLLIL
jgi:hypothetical protein